MPFGLCNAPATFQRAMMAIFADYLQKFMAVFVDDFTVYSSRADHLNSLRLMLEKCREKRVCLNPYKSLFGASKGVLLGHVVSKKAIEMADDKVKANLEVVAPTDMNGIDPRVCQHKIPLKMDAKPVRMQRYKMNPNYAKRVKEE